MNSISDVASFIYKCLSFGYTSFWVFTMTKKKQFGLKGLANKPDKLELFTFMIGIYQKQKQSY